MNELPPGTVLSGDVIDDDETVLARTKRSIKAADHLTDKDAGVVAVLLKLAEDCDTILSTGVNRAGKFDNVTVPTYLKYAESLGLTPAARSTMKSAAAPGATVSKIGQMREQHRTRAAS